MKKKTGIITGVIAAVVIIVIVAVVFNSNSNNGKPETEKPVVSEQKETAGKDVKPGKNEAEKETFMESIKEIIDSSTENTEEKPSGNKPAEETIPTISLPYEDKEYGLEVSAVKSYSGLYIENGEETAIENVATAIVKNNSDKHIEYAEVTLKGLKTDLKFKVTDLPKGAVMVVQELDMKPYTEQEYTAVTNKVATLDKFEMSEDRISVSQEGKRIKITNITDETIPVTRVFFKLYMTDKDVYVGGITYNIKLENLKPDEPLYAAPYHFDPENSKIMMVRTYDSAE